LLATAIIPMLTRINTAAQAHMWRHQQATSPRRATSPTRCAVVSERRGFNLSMPAAATEPARTHSSPPAASPHSRKSALPLRTSSLTHLPVRWRSGGRRLGRRGGEFLTLYPTLLAVERVTTRISLAHVDVMGFRVI
jgi:hypothetical protein